MKLRPVVATVVVVGLALLASPNALASGGNTISMLESGGVYVPSMQLDGNGYPVVVYVAGGYPVELRLVHCNDVSCLGDDESISVVDSDPDSYGSAALQLDMLGNPVIAYQLGQSTGLHIVHCDDANCIGGDEATNTYDIGVYARSPSLALDSAGNPVVSYQNQYSVPAVLKLLRCNDEDCGGGDDPVTTLDTQGQVSSTVVDSSNRPVVAYESNSELRLLHCNDTDCAGGDDSPAVIDTTGSPSNASVALDATGNPVVAYEGASGITLAHCDDAFCIGGGESLQVPYDPGIYTPNPYPTDLNLDSAGNPIISFTASSLSSFTVVVVHCDDANCAGGNDPAVGVDEGYYSASLAVDGSDKPVLAYRSLVPGAKVLRCSTSDCASAITATPIGTNVPVSLSNGISVTYPSITIAGVTSLSMAKSALQDLNTSGPYLLLSTTASPSWYDEVTVCIDYDDSGYTAGEEATLRFATYQQVFSQQVSVGSMWVDITTSLDTTTNRICGQAQRFDPFTYLPLVAGQDADGDGCPNDRELGLNQLTGGKRSGVNRWDYFNPSGDAKNRIDDVLLVVNQYFKDIYVPGYNPGTDRTLIGPDPWDLGPPNGIQRVDDILNQVHQYFHDCP